MNFMLSVQAFAILDSEGKRILAKYYNQKRFPGLKEQTTFENLIWSKTRRQNGEVLMLEKLIVVYREVADTRLFLVGSAMENEIMLHTVLTTYYDAMAELLSYNVNKVTILENFDYALLVLDELVDGGIILECDASNIVSRVSMQGMDDETPTAEQSVGQALS
eukprot:CAMPEP_0119132984 /NCGR_PEP_ID=MMETSP1310-20130426/12736_1 /TAXON_ID=464262 /ORGANISM="Genus nov. species nov., Strain RCC2339" /LENGTH=162 /DNA_ID=CAMNT_0007123653 /DNA_START=34 /DNA_END=518 /DNA_ORIENTATION=+